MGVLEILLDAGSNVTERDNVGWTMLFYAVYNGFWDYIKHLLDVGVDLTAVDNMEALYCKLRYSAKEASLCRYCWKWAPMLWLRTVKGILLST